MKAKVADNKLTLVTAEPNAQLGARDVKTTSNPLIFNESLAYSMGVRIGRLMGFESNRPLVQFPDCPAEAGLIAQTIAALSHDKIGRSLLIAFEDNNLERPIIIGLMVEPEFDERAKSAVNLEIDGERLQITAEHEIVLRCGEASVTLTRAGKVIIKGAYVLSRSSGYNKIKGAAVDIN
jgi:hypothetical protein